MVNRRTKSKTLAFVSPRMNGMEGTFCIPNFYAGPSMPLRNSPQISLLEKVPRPFHSLSLPKLAIKMFPLRVRFAFTFLALNLSTADDGGASARRNGLAYFHSAENGLAFHLSLFLLLSEGTNLDRGYQFSF